MSEAAVRERRKKQSWAAPGGTHDFIVRFLKVALPAAIGLLLAYLALSPLQKNREISFILDKDKVDVAPERMRVEAARYSGQDNRGHSWVMQAQSAVQATSREPVIDISGIAARIMLDNGPAAFRAERGRYDMDEEVVDVLGPILLTGADGYRLETRDVAVDLEAREMRSRGRVEGSMPLGRFSADRMVAHLPERRVVLEGRARLHIAQGALR